MLPFNVDNVDIVDSLIACFSHQGPLYSELNCQVLPAVAFRIVLFQPFLPSSSVLMLHNEHVNKCAKSSSFNQA